MGYSARYHAASLAAVFFALAVGILLGSQYGGDLLSNTRKDLEKSLTSDLDSARTEIKGLEEKGQWSDQFGRTVFPLLVESRLAGRRIGLIGLGDLPSEVTDAVEQALEPTGGSLVAVGAVRQPPDLGDLSESLAETRFARLDRRPEVLARYGSTIGHQLISGGRILDLSRSAVLSQSSGQFGRLEGLVVYHSLDQDLNGDDADLSEEFDSAILSGAVGTGSRVIGVETLGTDPSGIAFLKDRNLTTVDNIDMPSGKLSLVYSLNGAEGSFGVKSGATRQMPELLRPVFETPRLREPDGKQG